MTSPNKSIQPAASGPGRDAIVAALLAGLVLAVLLLTHPFANVPMNDDFSYARTAEALARTGRVVYNGWGSPLLWPQAAYGAVLIRWFGFSYALLAKTGVALAAVATGLFFLLARRCGCKPVCAVFATLALTMNPIFLCVAPSFMTDVPSLTLFLAMMLTLVRAVGTDADGSVRLHPKWLVASALVAIFAGSNRQLIWMTDLAALAALFALVPRQRKLVGVLLGVVLNCAITMNYWCESQPYSVSPNLTEGSRRLIAMPGAVAVSIFRYLDMGGLLMLPLALLALPRLRALGVRPQVVVVAMLVWAVLILTPYDTPYKMPNFGVFPNGEYFTSQGAMVGCLPGYSRRALPFSDTFSFALTLGGIASLGILSALIGRFLRALWTGRSAAAPSAADARQRVVLAVLLSAASIQFIVSFFWFCANNLFDRYLLLFLPGFLIFLGTQASQTKGESTRKRRQASWLLWGASGATALTAALGFAIAQEYAAYGHARADLYKGLLTAGVPATAINAGFEIDADTQIVTDGYVNSPQIVTPKGAFRPNVVSPHIPYIGDEFPAVDPWYRISADSVILPDEDAYPTPMRTATYHSLLPPFERHLYVYRIKR